jgi:hypothetical protein
MEGIAKEAIKILETKYIPQPASPLMFTPQDQYRQILPLLDVWGYQDNDKDVSDKAKFIYDKLVELNKENPAEALTTLLVDLGATKWNESKLDRINKYFHLR